MVKSKRDLKSPRRRNSLSLTNRPLTRLKSGTTSISTSTDPVSAANIKVVVRVRPPNEKEQDDNSRIVIKQVDEQMLVFDPKENAQPFFYHGVQQKGRDLLRRANKDLQFIFDQVFGFNSTNHDIFINTTQSLISSLMNGYNCSVFAYGATGAGKTHTMIGNNENPGITMLTMAELFKHKADLMSERDFELGITYLEVYNENVQDLLNPGTPLHLREDGKYGVMVAGNKIHKIDNPDELFSLLEQGNKNRTQHPTDANAESSRSHAVFQVYIQMNIRATSEMRTAKLSMIDLAGSERGAATGYSGARFTEGANINKSLLALGNCINSLADGQRHVPYRDSKLTRLLKDSLGGNCQTVMIANVSPSSLSYEDTYNTLKYATRAKKIKSNMKKNVVKVELHVGQYVKMVEELNKQVAKLKKELEERGNQAIVKSPDMSQSSQLMKLYAERKEALARIHQIEVSEQLCIMTRQSKEEANSRLSGLIIDSPELCEGHKKLGNTMQRCQKKETAYKEELASMETKKIELASKTADLVKKFPQLKQISETEECKLSKFESELKVELAKKERDFYKQQVEERGDLLSKMCQVLKPCYQQLRGHGLVSERLTESFQALISDMQGVRGIKWEKEVADSGMGSTRSNSSSDEEGRPIKRKLDEESAPSSTSLDSTFTLPSCKTKPKICASQLLAKVYKPPPPKRLAKLPTMSPRAKENRLLRKPLGNVDCGNGRVVSRDIKDVKGRKLETQPRRPPFRR